MKLKFKHQAFQSDAVSAVVDCFTGQVNNTSLKYRIDTGVKKIKVSDVPALSGLKERIDVRTSDTLEYGFKNPDLQISSTDVLKNIQDIQRRQGLPISSELKPSTASPINLDVEMETGTGKTYVYIKTIFELQRAYGWSKFIIVVPGVAIREGVYKSLSITSEHFQETYQKKARFFIYDSKQLHNLESFSSDANINVMIINMQAFNTRGKDSRRIFEELDDFQSRRPMDVIKANRPILILDEPQKMEGAKTTDALQEFNALFTLRYSATHKTEYNKIFRLDALDAYNQKLVKKIAVRGISIRGLSGTDAYLYAEAIEISKKAPVARIEIEVKQKNNLKRITKRFVKGDNLYVHSNELEQYKNNYVISEINANTETISFANGLEIKTGEALGDVNEQTLRRMQIREAIRAHFEKEATLFERGIKVLSLFFIDTVSKYRLYSEAGQERGEYAKVFEEEYDLILNDLLPSFSLEYQKYLKLCTAQNTHAGYFSIDKKSKRLVDPESSAKTKQSEDVDAYDLILKDKERLLSFTEPVRFIFSHSALREGWDNPNVFVICALKHTKYDNENPLRQEIGRGLRISVNQNGDRQDDPLSIHQINVLTVVASDDYKNIVTTLQAEYKAALVHRARQATQAYFTGKTIKTANGLLTLDAQMAKQIHRYLIQNNYIDDDDNISNLYREAVQNNFLAKMSDHLEVHAEEIHKLINAVYSDDALPNFENDRNRKFLNLNANYEKKEFKELWQRINKKAVYTVDFDSRELIQKSITAVNTDLKVALLQVTIERGEQVDTLTLDHLDRGDGFKLSSNELSYNELSISSAVPYDLIGKVAERTNLTRRTVGQILKGMTAEKFAQFQQNPENFIQQVARIIDEQKACIIIEHLSYDLLQETFDSSIFAPKESTADFSSLGEAVKKHIYDYVQTDSNNERNFVEDLDTNNEVVVYAKLPRGFYIPTPVGQYHPDWAIAFQAGQVKHIFFVAETKGDLSSLELRKIEDSKINCARKFFAEINKKFDPEVVRYDVVDSFGKLMDVVRG